MEYIVDIFLILIFGTVIITSMKKGFFKSLFDLCGTIVSVILARFLSEGFATQGYNIFVKKAAEAYLGSALGEVGTKDYALQAEEIINSIPDALGGLMNLMGIDKQAIIDKVSEVNLGGDNLLETIMTNVVEPVGTAVVQFILFVLMAIAFGFVLKIVVKFLDKIIKKLPAFKQFNSVLGAVLGAIEGLIVVVIISTLIGIVASFIGNEAFNEAVSNSVIIATAENIVSVVSGAATV
ncbi:MAG: CvpA family protein [Clostridia bacterium]|nr:CvpA family protein [Clostridia bacterium]